MKDKDKTKEQFINELVELRQRVAHEFKTHPDGTMQKEEGQLRCQLTLLFRWRPQGYSPFTPVFIYVSENNIITLSFTHHGDIESHSCSS